MKDEELELILPEKCSPQIWKNLTLGCCSLVELETSIACATCAICRNGNGADWGGPGGYGHNRT